VTTLLKLIIWMVAEFNNCKDLNGQETDRLTDWEQTAIAAEADGLENV